MQTYKILCNQCGKVDNPFYLANIVASGYWSSSPSNLNCLFLNEVFILWDQFRKQMPGSSEIAFLKSLDELTIVNGRVCI